MPDTVPAADVRALAAAIRTALDPPKAALSVERARLLEDRAAYVNGALLIVATGKPVISVRAATDVILEAVNDVPVTYEVQTMLSAPLPRGRYDAASAAEVAEGVDAPTCHNVAPELWSCSMPHGHPGDHVALSLIGDPGVVAHRWPNAEHLAPPAPYGHQSLQPKAGA